MNDLKDKRVFLIGGAGFIGSHIVEELLRNAAQVTVFDNFSTGQKKTCSTCLKIRTLRF